MKKIIFIISITLLALNSQAQGTLQFNQVITIAKDTSFSFAGNGGTSYKSWDLYTVPENRVLKITKAINSKSSSGSSGCTENNIYFTINGINTTIPLFEDAWL